MTKRPKRSLLARAGLVLWGMLTLALLFSVILLGAQLAKLGSNPLSFAVPEPAGAGAAEQAGADAPETKTVTLYFVDTQSGLLAAERRELALSGSTSENAKRVVAEIIRGPAGELAPVLPSSAQVRGAFLLESGELVVDLTADAMDTTRSSAAQESRIVYALANTLTQSVVQAGDTPVRTVRLLIDGASYSGHADLSSPYGPSSEWIAAAEGAS